MNEEKRKKAVSPCRLAANRENAKRSTGPRTELGKQRASENSYKHGFFARRLFSTQEVQKQDLEEYNSISRAYWNHYNPVGDLEKLCVEQIAVQSLRLARMLGHDAKVLAYETPFELRSVDKIVRYESNIGRRLEKTIARLEQLQQERKAAQSNPSQGASSGEESVEEQARNDDSTEVSDAALAGIDGSVDSQTMTDDPR